MRTTAVNQREWRGGLTASAFDRLYRLYSVEVLAYCVRRTDRHDAEDAAAETFAIAWRRIEDVPEGDDARLWLYGVARRVLLNQHRSLRRWMRLQMRVLDLGRDHDAGPEMQVVRNAEGQRVLDALAKLPIQDQELLRLDTWEELSRREIALVLGISRNAVDQRYFKAKARLAKELRRLDRRAQTSSQSRDVL